MSVILKAPLGISLYIHAFHKNKTCYLYPRFDGLQSRFSLEIKGRERSRLQFWLPVPFKQCGLPMPSPRLM